MMVIDINKRYVLNSAYSIYYDVDRYLIGTSMGGGDNFFSPIHPMYAKLFSFFDGRKMNEILKDASEFFSLTKEEFLDFVTQFVDNDEYLTIDYAGCRFSLPKCIIVEAERDEVALRKDFDIFDTKLEGILNLERRRLSIPKTIVYVINTKCATDCIYCYADKNTKYDLMPTERVLNMIDEAHKLGVIELEISGGEFFLHKDWPQIVKKCKDCGYMKTPSTKVPISKKVVDQFKSVGLDSMQVSLDSVDARILKKTLNVADAYRDMIMDSIRYMDGQGISLVIKGTQTSYTCDVENIKSVIDFIRTLKNVKRYTVSIVGYSHYKTVDDYKRFRPSKQQVESLEAFLNEIRERVPFEILFDNNQFCESNLANEEIFNKRALCSGNVNGFVVLPDGKVTICEELYWNPEFIIGDLKNNTIMDVWNSEKATKLWNFQQNILTDDNPCKCCGDFHECRKGLGVCWKSVIAHYGKNNSHYPDPNCPKAPKPLYDVYYEYL